MPRGYIKPYKLHVSLMLDKFANITSFESSTKLSKPLMFYSKRGVNHLAREHFANRKSHTAEKMDRQHITTETTSDDKTIIVLYLGMPVGKLEQGGRA